MSRDAVEKGARADYAPAPVIVGFSVIFLGERLRPVVIGEDAYNQTLCHR